MLLFYYDRWVVVLVRQNIHYCDVIMGEMASQITSLTIVYSTFYSGADQRKNQSSASLAGNSPVTGEFPAQMASNWKIFPFDDVIVSMQGEYDKLSNTFKKSVCPAGNLTTELILPSTIYIHINIYVYIYIHCLSGNLAHISLPL